MKSHHHASQAPSPAARACWPWTFAALALACGADPAPPATVGSGTKDTSTSSDGSGGADVQKLETSAPDAGKNADTTVIYEPGKPGAPCLAAEDCDSGWCVATPEGKQCSELCIESCTLVGWGCKSLTQGADDITLCLPSFPNLCDPCRAHTDCNLNDGDTSSFCIAREDGNGSFCGADCSSNDICPTGYLCADVDLGAAGIKRQCTPTSGVCACSESAIALALSTECRSTNESGACLGTRTCTSAGLTDCDAATPAGESCNGKDDDCDGVTDEQDAVGCTTFYRDVDKDNYGQDNTPKCLCAPEGEWSAVEAGDCQDAVQLVSPAVQEVCDFVDNDCDGTTDEQNALGCTKRYADVDEDGWGDKSTEACLCAADEDHPVELPGDCDDSLYLVKPGGAEVCGGSDDDCDGITDPAGAGNCVIHYRDVDVDTFGVLSDSKCLCAPQSPYTATASGDCDDGSTGVKPGAPEVCGGLDDDCDGQTDPPGSGNCATYFRDNDNDKTGDTNDSLCLCAPSGPYAVLTDGDCNDSDPSVSPTATEACNDKDDDCDAITDEPESAGCKTWYLDADDDTFGDAENSLCACDSSGDYTTLDAQDCDDERAERNPDATEACGNGADDDCDGLTDEEGGSTCTPFYRDVDQDTFGNASDFRCLCGPSGVYSTLIAGDCADDNPALNSGATETCNGLDDNCNGLTDEANAVGCTDYYDDADMDGYGVTALSKCLCGPSGATSAVTGGDCKDTNDSIYPNQVESCNGADDDCNSVVDDEGALGCETRFFDKDKDNFGAPGSGKCVCPGASTLTATKGGDCNDDDLLVYPGTTCGTPSCSGFSFTAAPLCDGEGSCVSSNPSPCPGGFVCDSAIGCKSFCGGNADCITGNFCVTGLCTGKKLDGSTCGAPSECQSNHCENGFCCQSGKCCGGAASQCDDGNGCTDNACSPTFQCTATPNTSQCASALCDGDTYTNARTCKGGFCSEGGQETACASTDACKVPSCSLAAGGCTTKPATPGTPCTAATCTGSTLTAAKVCDGNGTCTAGGQTSTCPGGFTCEASGTACRLSCAIDAHCRSSYYCDGGVCLPLEADGSTCGSDTQCVSGHCDSGVCCKSGDCCRNTGDCDDQNLCTTELCTGSYQCQTTPNTLSCAGGQCNTSGDYVEAKYCSNGACTVGGQTVSCASNDPCKIDTCNASTGGCGAKAAPIGTSCAIASCTGFRRVGQKVCDGLGSCTLGGSEQPCAGGFVCATDGLNCKTSCANDSECQPSYFCESQACVPKRVDGGTCGAASNCISGNCSNATCCGAGKTCCQADTDCSDGNPCTVDACNGSFFCSTSFAGPTTECAPGSCSGLTRTRPKTCNGLGSCSDGGTTENCDKGNLCLAYACTPSACTNTLAGNGTVCAPSTCSGSLLTPIRTCTSGTCKVEASGACIGGYVCEVGTGKCASSCVNDAGCQSAYFCSAGGTCQEKRLNGEACTKSSQCVDAHCSNGYCCKAGKCCVKDGDCGDDNTCTDDKCSLASFSCNNPNNTADCLGGFCLGLLHFSKRTCLTGACAQGGVHTDCTPTDPQPCLEYGCDPATGCSSSAKASGTVCGSSVCTGTQLTGASTCDGNGGCVPPSASTCAGGYACDSGGTACRTSCIDGTHCGSSHYCAAPNCVPKKVAGSSCSAATECASGYCNNGHCCASGKCCNADTDCGDGESCTTDTCNASKQCVYTKLTIQCAGKTCDGLVFSDTKFCGLSTGTCSQGGVTQDCNKGNECYQYGCDASLSGNPCTQTPRTGAPCGAGPTCSGHTFTSQSTCNGSGQCILAAGVDCPNGLLCATDGISCRASCTSDTDCRSGRFCELATGRCSLKLANGVACGSSTHCTSGYCGNGFCCANTGGTPKCCPDAAYCDDSNACTTDSCDTNYQCANTAKTNGTQCGAPFCIGNVPYQSRTCTTGVCGPQQAGTACNPSAPSLPICQTSVCNPSIGACELQPLVSGTPCSTTSCSSGNVTTSQTCNGAGTCQAVSQVTVPCPGNFACLSGTECRKVCTQDSHCQTGYICDGQTCRNKKTTGESCSIAAHCESGNCNKGICCGAGLECCASEADCTGNTGVSPGERCVGCVNSACGNKSAATVCRGAFCSGTSRIPPQTCLNGTCPAGTGTSCVGTDPCISYTCTGGACTTPLAPTGTTCGTKRCQGVNELVLPSSCSGTGQCVEPSATVCPGNLRCNDAGSDCRPGCVSDSHCVAGYYCAANVCVAKKARGVACSGANQCSTGYCNNGYCCDSGTCCSTSANCTASSICHTPTCSNSICANTPAPNKVCTDASCSASQVFTPEGRCDSNGTCVLSGPSQDCSTGSTACLLKQCSLNGCISVSATAGTACGAASCSVADLVPAKWCDGNGACVVSGASTPCSGHLVCANSSECKTACLANADCRSGYYCDLGTCTPLRPNGAPCSTGTMCISTHCEGGLCCNSGECCLGANECTPVSCKDATCVSNTCTYSNSSAVCAVGSCGGIDSLTYSAPKTCAGGSCPANATQTNCNGSNVCKLYSCDPIDGCKSANKASGTECLPSKCTGATLTSASRCDGAGSCTVGATGACTNGYQCTADGSACRTSCTSDSHCVSSRICMGGACVPLLADGTVCTGNPQCQSGYCGNGICCAPGGQCCTAASQCNDSNLCTDDLCTGFVCAHANNNKPCAAASCAGATYSAAKTCSGGSCSAGGATTNCDLGQSCMVYECSQTLGCISNAAEQGLPCGDANCSGTLFTPPSVCDGFGNCAPSPSTACDDNNVCTGAETCSTTLGCVAGNPAAVWVCGDGVCQSNCESAASCPADCTLSPAYTLTLGEYDAWSTGNSGATNKISKYSCNALNYPGAEYAYRLTTATAGTVTVSLGGADSNTDFMILSDNSGDPSKCVVVGTGSGSAKSFSAAAGSTYVLVVDRRVAGTTPFTLYARMSGSCKVRLTENWDRNAYPRAWTGENNWQTSQDSPFGATHVKFAGSPVITAFSRALTSPIFDLSSCTTATLKLKWRVTENTADPSALPHAGVVLRVESSTNGGTNWTTQLSYNTGGGPTPPPYVSETIPLTIPAGSVQGRLRFVVTGDTSQYLLRIQIEDIEFAGP